MFTKRTTVPGWGSNAALALLLLARTARGHMQLSWPYPLHSTFNPDTPEDIKDYSMTSPLTTDGKQYPCKGYIENPSGSPAMDPTVTYAAGQTYNITLAGTAVHGGGSCQISMSYDNGGSWNVIQSYMGGCMTDALTWDVAIPSEAPSGTAVFAWSWFNYEGNREMYSNCAIATVTGGGSGLTGPSPFVANAGVNECVTVANANVVFPDPGLVVKYGGVYASSRPTTPTGFTGSICVGPGASTSGSNGTAAVPGSTGGTSPSTTETTGTAATSSGVQGNANVSTSPTSAGTQASNLTTTTSTTSQTSTNDTTPNDAPTQAVTTTTTSNSTSSDLPSPYIRFSCSSSTSFWDGLEGEVQSACPAGTVCLYCGTTSGTPCVFPGSTCGSSSEDKRAALGEISRDRQRRRSRAAIGKGRRHA